MQNTQNSVCGKQGTRFNLRLRLFPTLWQTFSNFFLLQPETFSRKLNSTDLLSTNLFHQSLTIYIFASLVKRLFLKFLKRLGPGLLFIDLFVIEIWIKPIKLKKPEKKFCFFFCFFKPFIINITALIKGCWWVVCLATLQEPHFGEAQIYSMQSPHNALVGNREQEELFLGGGSFSI